MGFSIASGVEVVYWLVFRMWVEHNRIKGSTKVKKVRPVVNISNGQHWGVVKSRIKEIVLAVPKGRH